VDTCHCRRTVRGTALRVAAQGIYNSFYCVCWSIDVNGVQLIGDVIDALFWVKVIHEGQVESHVFIIWVWLTAYCACLCLRAAGNTITMALCCTLDSEYLGKGQANHIARLECFPARSLLCRWSKRLLALALQILSHMPSDSNPPFKAPPGYSLLDADSIGDGGEFDWDAINNNPNLELWLMRIPNSVSRYIISPLFSTRNMRIDTYRPDKPTVVSKEPSINHILQSKSVEAWRAGPQRKLLHCLVKRAWSVEACSKRRGIISGAHLRRRNEGHNLLAPAAVQGRSIVYWQVTPSTHILVSDPAPFST
jgi:hypothetical protein